MVALSGSTSQPHSLTTPVEVIHHVFMRGRWPAPHRRSGSSVTGLLSVPVSAQEPPGGFVEVPLRTSKALEVVDSSPQDLLSRLKALAPLPLDEEPPAKRLKKELEDSFDVRQPPPLGAKSFGSQAVVAIDDAAPDSAHVEMIVDDAGEEPNDSGKAAAALASEAGGIRRTSALRTRAPQGEVSSMHAWLASSSQQLKPMA
mmetsp:Transcript_7442/g.16435  ORF Transcript_7442/g.16435 Transcript_7442/m.16435 type:complete len:201 (+) Transcript_7442:168-770(+)